MFLLLNKFTTAATALLVLSSVISTGASQPEQRNLQQQEIDADVQTNITIAEFIREATDYSLIFKIFNDTQPNLLEFLDEPDIAWTAFLPTDETLANQIPEATFNKLQLPNWTLHRTAWASLHLLASALTEIPTGSTTIYSLEGTDLTLTKDDNGNIFINNIAVLEIIEAGNGFIYQIAGALDSPVYSESAQDLSNRGESYEEYNRFYEILDRLGISLTGRNTVLLPHNFAFDEYDVDWDNESGNSDDLVRQIISYHIFPSNNVYATTLAEGNRYATQQGEEVEVTASGFNEAKIVSGNLLVTEGVIYKTNKILIPPSLAGQVQLITSEAPTLSPTASPPTEVDSCLFPPYCPFKYLLNLIRSFWEFFGI